MTRTVGALVCALLVGCQVITLGDSNTCGWRTSCADQHFYWPERMTDDPRWPRGWSVVNRGVPGMTAGDYGNRRENGDPLYDGFYLDRILDTDLAHACTPILRVVHPRKLVIALGTNDLRRDATPNGIAQMIAPLRDRALQAKPCLDVYVATIPPRRPIGEDFRARVNAALARVVPPDRLIPFGDPPGADVSLGQDGVHFTDAGQAVRARVALAALFPER